MIHYRCMRKTPEAAADEEGEALLQLESGAALDGSAAELSLTEGPSRPKHALLVQPDSWRARALYSVTVLLIASVVIVALMDPGAPKRLVARSFELIYGGSRGSNRAPLPFAARAFWHIGHSGEARLV
jgi:hypothetical protein